MNIVIPSTKVTKGIHIVANRSIIGYIVAVIFVSETGKACKGDEVYTWSKKSGFLHNTLQFDH